ncbi:MAG TPA: hypothetical protein VHI13_05270 [Candidatus Kapabacteria bacterium]|nr:hypothetical protein [Candidatus Kapabacteria bacterium]
MFSTTDSVRTPFRPCTFIRHAALVLLLSAMAHLPAIAQSVIGSVYYGTIGDSTGIVIVLGNGDTGGVSSYYYYCNYARQIALSGRVEPRQHFAFEEQAGDNGQVTGQLLGTIDDGGRKLSGEWMDPKGQRHLKLSAEHVADLITVDTLWRHSNVHGAFSATYPHFLGGMGKGYMLLNDSLDALIAEERKSLYDWFVEESQNMGAGDSSEYGIELATNLSIDVAMIAGEFVTFAGHGEYDGGAHPSYSMPHYNYNVTGNRVRPVDRERIFRKGSGFRAKLGKMLYAELKRTEYPCMESLDQSTLEYDDNALSFAVAGRGLLFRLWPGPHVCGPAEDIFIPYSRIRDLIDPSGPLAPLVGDR